MGVVYLSRKNELLSAKFEYNEEMIKYCKSFHGQWDPMDKVWMLPFKEAVIECFVSKYSAILSPAIINELFYMFPAQWAESIRQQAITVIPSILQQSVEFDRLFKDFGKTLRLFQIEGIIHLSVLGGRAILGDEMGLGKSVQALGYWHLHNLRANEGKTLIVCPKNVRFNWIKEIEECTKKLNLRGRQLIAEISGRKPQTLPEAVFYVINYDILDAWEEVLKSLKFNLVVYDEAHYIKSGRAKRTKAAVELCKDIPHALALTGTPILNKVIELWTVLHMLKPAVFSNKKNFVEAYTNVSEETKKLIERGNIDQLEDDEEFSSGKNLEALNSVLREHILVRRTKKEVLKDLPPKNRIIQYAELSEDDFRSYQKAEEEFSEELRKNRLTLGRFLRGSGIKQGNILAALEKARQYALRGKMPAVYEWIDNFIENTEEKLVVFIHHRDEHQRLCEKYENICVSIKGGDSDKHRKETVERFQTDVGVRLAIISIMAGAEGITLTAASNALIIETAWSPGKTEQAEDRIHRIGQTADSVSVYHMVGAETVDEPIYKLLDKKMSIIDKALEQNQRDDGLTIEKLLTELNNNLNVLGLRVVFDAALLAQYGGVNTKGEVENKISTPNQNKTENKTALPEEKWYSLLEAARFAQAAGAKITKQNLWDDIRAGRLEKGTDVVWIKSEFSPAQGYWRINESAILRRIQERSKGRGRKKRIVG